MFRLAVLVFMLLGGSISAQTKLIAHKSHGGSAADFHAALEAEDRLLAGSDFGVAPVREVTLARLDTVIFVSRQEAVMITSFGTYTADQQDGTPISDTSRWQPGREVVYDHPLFQHQHRLDWIKAQLDEHFNFTNPADSTVFIGFDNQAEQQQQPSGSQQQDQQNSGQNDPEPSPAPAPAPRERTPEHDVPGSVQLDNVDPEASNGSSPIWALSLLLPLIFLVGQLRRDR